MMVRPNRPRYITQRGVQKDRIAGLGLCFDLDLNGYGVFDAETLN